MAGRVANGRKGPQVREEREGGWTEERREAVLAEIAVTLNISASCRKVGMSHQSLYKLKARDPEFRAGLAQAIAWAYDQMEMNYLKRGVHGTRRPVFQGGRKVGHVVEYPDGVAMKLLSAHRETAMRVRREDAARKDELELARLRLSERLSEMNRRLGGEG